MALAFDLFMVEDDLIKENELNKIINGGTTKRKNLMSNLLVVTDNTHLNENLEIKIKKDKGNIDFSENEISEIKVKKCKGSYDEIDFSENKIFKIQDSKESVYSYKKENLEKEMIKSYMKLLSH